MHTHKDALRVSLSLSLSLFLMSLSCLSLSSIGHIAEQVSIHWHPCYCPAVVKAKSQIISPLFLSLSLSLFPFIQMFCMTPAHLYYGFCQMLASAAELCLCSGCGFNTWVMSSYGSYRHAFAVDRRRSCVSLQRQTRHMGGPARDYREMPVECL